MTQALLLSLLAVAVLCLGAPARAGVPVIFEPYLRDVPPTIVEELPEKRIGDTLVREFWFLSRRVPATGKEYHIHCILARPTAPGPHPGIVFCHGGSGYLDRERTHVVGWAQRGYVCIGQDAPGICSQTEAKSRGPYFDGEAITFQAEPDATASALYDGLVAVLNSLALLRSQPDVDRDRIGIFGGSWGGYTATMIASLAGDRIRAAFSIYGCGFYDLGSCWMPTLDGMADEPRREWLDNLDAGRQAANMRADYAILVANNDWFFWPPAATATLDAIPGERHYLFAPNDYHEIRQPGGTLGPPTVDTRTNRTYMEVRYMDWKLKGVDNPFPRAEARGPAERAEDGLRVRFWVASKRPIAAAGVYWSAGEMPWRFRWWERVEATDLGQGEYEAVLPVEQPEYPMDWVAVVSDDDNASVSTRIQRADPRALGFDPGRRTDVLFAEDFEGPLVHWRWRWTPITPRGEGGTYRARCPEAAHSGKLGLMLQGPYSCCAWGFRAAPIRSSGARGLRLWARAAGDCPVTGLQVQLAVELDRAQRHLWTAADVAAATLTPQWQRFEVPWDRFVYAGDGDPPVPLLSDGLGELRFTLAEPDQAVYVDDIEVVRPEG